VAAGPWQASHVTPRDGGIRVKLIPGCRKRSSGSQNSGASRAGLRRRPAASSILDGVESECSGSDIQSLGRGKEAELAFIEAAVSLIEICLTHMADAECPKQVRGERLCVIADGEGVLVALW